MKAATLAALLRARGRKQGVALVTELAGGAQAIVMPDPAPGETPAPAPPAPSGETAAPASPATPGETPPAAPSGETAPTPGETGPAIEGDLPLGPALIRFAMDALAEDRPRSLDLDGRRYFVQVYTPPRRLIVIGAVHIAQSLAPMAALAGYEVVVVDPRRAFATPERFPGIALDTRWPDEALAALAPDRRSAIVTLTHDAKLDDPALAAALATDAFYIGALGSRRTHAERLERLREAGHDEAALARIHAPVGLDIGAVSPAEIAVSILAEMTGLLHRRPYRPGQSAAPETAG